MWAFGGLLLVQAFGGRPVGPREAPGILPGTLKVPFSVDFGSILRGKKHRKNAKHVKETLQEISKNPERNVTLIRATEELFVYSPDGGLLVGIWWAFGGLPVRFRFHCLFRCFGNRGGQLLCW